MKHKRSQTFLKLFLFTLLVTIGLAACAPAVEQGSLAGPEWRLVSLNGEPVPAEVTITAAFGEAEVAGNSACNSYSGPYTVDGATIQIGPLASTLMACEEPIMTWEGNFLGAMQAAQTFTVTATELEIATGEGSLEFTAE
jgi:heat shock protein HslJ